MRIGNIELRHGLFVAPMAGISDMSFRRLCMKMGAEYSVSEMVCAKALCYEQKCKKNASDAFKTGTLAAVMKKYPQYTLNLSADGSDKTTFLVDTEIKREIAASEEEIGDGRLLIRPSGTEPLIRIMAEGNDPDLIRKICEDLSKKIKERLDELKNS